jgi:thiamine biosynthesis lipoprotein ApbE
MDALERYQEALAKGLATDDVKQVLLAAYDGRVSTVFVATGVHQWGQFDPQHWRIRVYKRKRPGAEDLLDLVAASTLTKGGLCTL